MKGNYRGFGFRFFRSSFHRLSQKLRLKSRTEVKIDKKHEKATFVEEDFNIACAFTTAYCSFRMCSRSVDRPLNSRFELRATRLGAVSWKCAVMRLGKFTGVKQNML